MKKYFSLILFYLKQPLQSQKNSIHPVDIALFLRQFATLNKAGIPIIRCCDILENSQEKSALRILIASLKKNLLAGKTLFYSMQNHAEYFDKLTCQLIKMGEHTGQLDHMLMMIAHHQEKQLALKKRIRQALFYPCIIIFMAFLISMSLFIFVIPKFAELFQDTRDKLPLFTLWIFYFSTKINDYFYLLLSGIFLFVILLFINHHSNKRKHHFMAWIHQLPWIKAWQRKIICARFTRHLGITLAAGISILDALKLTAQSSNDLEFTLLITKITNKICSGFSLHQALASFTYFPSLLIQMIKVGEESGQISVMLEKIADFLEAEIDQSLSYLNQLLEPLIMIVLGVLIGGLIIGMYLPIFKLGNTL